MKKRRVLSLFLAVVMTLGTLVLALPELVIPAEAAAATGTAKANASGSADRWIKQDTYWDTKEAIDEAPLTFEAVIRHKNVNPKKGVWLGNYVNETTPSISFYVTVYGRPEIRIINSSGKSYKYNFGNQSTKTYVDEGTTVTLKQCLPFADSVYLHVAFTIDPVNGVVKYYQNGVLYGVVEASVPAVTEIAKVAAMRTMRIGGDYRTDNTEFWTGAMHYVAIYNTTFTTSQVKARYEAGTWLDGDSLIAAWDLSKQGENACRDRSGNGNDLVYHQGDGLRIDTFGSYTIDQPLSGTPETVEAWLWMPTCYNTRGGTFIGNYGSGSSAYFSFEIQNNGRPRCFINNGDGTSATYTFDQIDIRNHTWTHVAFVHDPAYVIETSTTTTDETTGEEITTTTSTTGAMLCYINGEMTQAIASTLTFSDAILEEYCHFGGDRQGNGQTQRYNGYIKELRVYDDARSAAEVASDLAGNVDYTDDNIVLHYDLKEMKEYTSFSDLTGNGNDVTYNQVWYDEVLPVEEYAYSLAVVGDTQTVTVSNADKLKNIYQWILDNQEAKNIQYVIGLGDITEKGEDWGHKNNDTEAETAVGDAEWAAALEAISMMDGKIPYSLIRGAGHDGRERFNEWFGDHEGYTQNIAGYYKEGRIENVYHTFTIGETDYMILCLDFGAKDDVLEWANELVAAHPAHRVIVTTHGYLEPDGSLLETGEAYCPSSSYYDSTNNDGDDLWNKFVRKHANICMVMCGHMTTSDVIVSKQTGDYGNEVTQILIDPQGLDTSSAPRGMVAMLYFSEDGTQVDVEYYSTITDVYRPSSEFTVSYGGTVAPSYDDLSDEYLIVQNPETELYSVIKNEYFSFLGGALRYSDATEGYANIRFGYSFDASFDLGASNWKWNYGVVGSGLTNEKTGANKNAANRTNLVITNVPAAYFADGMEAQLCFDVTLDGVTYTAIDRVRTRSVLGVAQSIASSPYESAAAKSYAQGIIDSLNAG
ncbi:MAG: hypothetical protein E7643_02235 [Ruminococcaceae bacterium]|nr:hypothetical protein [Oscillospiraceae bacterium]